MNLQQHNFKSNYNTRFFYKNKLYKNIDPEKHNIHIIFFRKQSCSFEKVYIYIQTISTIIPYSEKVCCEKNQCAKCQKSQIKHPRLHARQTWFLI